MSKEKKHALGALYLSIISINLLDLSGSNSDGHKEHLFLYCPLNKRLKHSW